MRVPKSSDVPYVPFNMNTETPAGPQNVVTRVRSLILWQAKNKK